MTPLAVFFDVPDLIVNGLNSGVLERVGGVIRDTASKQVVTWLQEYNPVNTTSSLPTPLNIILTAAKMAVTIHDGRVTRKAIKGVSQQIEGVSGQIAALSNFVAVGQVLNFGLTAVSLYVTLQRLNQLSDEIAQLGQTVQREFDRERDTRFKVALQAARDVFESDQSAYRDNAARTALDGLYEAYENFMTDFDAALKSNSPHRLLLAKHYLLRAMYAETSRVRCYMISNRVETARKRLLEDMPRFRNAVIQLVTEWLSKKPAIHFYKDVADETLDRFFQIQRWLMSPDDVSEVSMASAMFASINHFRGDFWNQEVIQDAYDNTFNQIARRPAKTLANKLAALPDSLSNAEMIIENYQHLLGFELELRSLRLSAEERQNLLPDSELQQYGFAMIVDEDALQTALSRLPS